jgi:methyltransferase (TIGR00027 family)
MSASPISNISDTARWVAVYRAWESARPDALFRDPYADSLAGERGRAIARLMPKQARSGWPIIARTRLIDDLVQAAIAQGCDCVLNLAAGLDTRPYRLELPESLRWVEADLPQLVDEKERALADAKPRCQLSRIRVDLADAGARAQMLRDAVGSSRKALVIAEGLLVYLEEPQVRALAADLLARSGVRWWTVDVASPELVEMLQKSMGRYLASAPMKFGPPDGVAYFEVLGWRVDQVHSIFHAARRFGRLPWFLRLFALLPQPDPRSLGRARWSAVVQLERPSPRSLD